MNCASLNIDKCIVCIMTERGPVYKYRYLICWVSWFYHELEKFNNKKEYRNFISDYASYIITYEKYFIEAANLRDYNIVKLYNIKMLLK